MIRFDLQRFAIKTVINGEVEEFLPVATTSDRGGVVVGDGVSVDSTGKISIPDATTVKSGLMSSSDKKKLNGIASGAQVNVTETVKVNGAALTPSSKSVNVDISGKVDKVSGKQLSTNDYTTNEKNKLSAIDSGAQVNVIETVKVNNTALEVTDKAVNIDISGKVDKVSGKSLSTNDYTTTEKNKLASIESGAQVNVIETVKVNDTALTPSNKTVTIDISGKVDKVSGKGLSTNDYTTTEKNKLSGIASGAQVNVIESISIDGTNQTISSKKVALNLSDYAKKSDIASGIRIKGSVNSFSDLPTNAVTGDLYNIKTAGGTDGEGIAIRAGDNVVRTEDGKWDVMAGTVDLSNYVQKDGSKVLSTNDYTTAEKNKLSSIASGAQVNVIETVKIDGTALNVSDKSVNIDISGKVDKVSGKGLSTNDYTTTEKNKLAGIAEQANKYVLPTAQSSVIGGVKVDSVANSNIVLNSSGAISVPAASTSQAGVVKYGGGTTNYLRADGTWAKPPDNNTTYSAGTGISLSGTTFGLKNASTAESGGVKLDGNTSKFLNGNGQWATPPNDTYAVMTGATTAKGGAQGLVPAPSSLQSAQFLKGDGTWGTPTNSTTKLIVGASNSTVNATTTNGNTYIRLFDDTTARESHKISGAGATTVTSDSNGNIIVNTAYGQFSTTEAGLAPKSDGATTKYLRADGTWTVPPNDNTTYSAGTGLTLSGTTLALKDASTAESGGIKLGGDSSKFLNGNGQWVTPTDTNNKVAQNIISTIDNTYPILLASSANATSNIAANTVGFGSEVKVNPKTSNVIANTFTGSLSGNALTSSSLQTARALQVSLNKTTSTNFQGDAAVTDIGVQGTLQPAQGGTGQTVLSSVTVGAATKANQWTNAKSLKVSLASTTAQTINGTNDATVIGVGGILPVSLGGTGASVASTARTNLGLGDMATKKASDYLTKTTNVSEMGRYIDMHYDNATSKYDYDIRLQVNSQGTVAGGGVLQIVGTSVKATKFEGPLTGNVTGNCSGSSGSCTGLAAKATGDKNGLQIDTNYAKLSAANTFTGQVTANDGLKIPLGKAIVAGGTNSNYQIIRNLAENSEGWRHDILIESGSAMIVAAGEAGSSAYNSTLDAITKDSENLYLMADSSVIVYSNANATANRKTFTFGTDGVLTVPTLKGAVDGNAATATKWATARSLKVSLASSSAQNIDGTGNATVIGVGGVLPVANGGTGATTQLGIYNTIKEGITCVQYQGGTNVNPWHKVASIILNGTWCDATITFAVKACTRSSNSGILSIHVGTNSTVPDIGEIGWLNNTGLNISHFRLKMPDARTDPFEVWCYVGGTNGGYRFTVLDASGSRTGKSLGWTLYNNTSGGTQAAEPSGGTIINSSLVGKVNTANQDGSGNVITSTYLTKTDASNSYLGKTANAASATKLSSDKNITVQDNSGTNTISSGTYGSGNITIKLPNTISAGNFTGNVTGNCSGSSGSCTGLSAKATGDKNGADITTTYAKLSADNTFSGKVILSKTTDASGTAAGNCALQIGDTAGTHLEFDGNEIMAKSNVSTPSSLFINSDGGLTNFGTGGVSIKGGGVTLSGGGLTASNQTIEADTFDGSLRHTVNAVTTTGGSYYDAVKVQMNRYNSNSIHDFGFIRFGNSQTETGNDEGYLELATGDDGSEPIYVKQYKFLYNPDYSPGNHVRQATLLDSNGNTEFPGTVTAAGFNGNAGSATKWATARSLKVSLASSAAQTINGEESATAIGVGGILPVANGGTGASVFGGSWYADANCTTEAATANKEISCPGFVLRRGAIVGFYLETANTASNPKLAVNGTTAKYLYKNSTRINTTAMVAGVYVAIYDGSAYKAITMLS